MLYIIYYRIWVLNELSALKKAKENANVAADGKSAISSSGVVARVQMCCMQPATEGLLFKLPLDSTMTMFHQISKVNRQTAFCAQRYERPRSVADHKINLP